jgi:hypothetical protein
MSESNEFSQKTDMSEANRSLQTKLRRRESNEFSQKANRSLQFFYYLLNLLTL